MSDLGFSLLQNGSMSFSSVTDFDKAKNYTDKEITIKSISANGSAIVPDENKNVDIDIKGVVKQSYLFGTGAPTKTTPADFEGQMYSDTENKKLYQCVSITNNSNGSKSYEWIKVIRENDYAGTVKNNDFEYGVVCVAQSEGLKISNRYYGTTVGYKKVLELNGAEKEHFRTYFKNPNLVSNGIPIGMRSFEYATVCGLRKVIGNYVVQPLVSGITASLSINLLYPFEYDGYKVYTNNAEISDGIISKEKSFVTAPIIFDGENAEIKFYLKNTEVFSARIKKLDEIAHAVDGKISYGVLTNGYVPIG